MRIRTSVRIPSVFVIDPDPATGRMIKGFLQETTLPCQTFGSGREFFAAYQEGQPGCLVLETLIPDMSGLQIHKRLAASNSLLPLIFVASRMNVSTAVELIRQGVVHVLEKPVRRVDLHGAIHEAIALDAERRRQHNEQQAMRLHVAGLTRKERQVLQLIGDGKSVKAMAAELGICVRAIELRRRSLMAKLDLRFSVGSYAVPGRHPPDHPGTSRAQRLAHPLAGAALAALRGCGPARTRLTRPGLRRRSPAKVQPPPRSRFGLPRCQRRAARVPPADHRRHPLAPCSCRSVQP